GADEEDRATTGDRLDDEVVGAAEEPGGLVEVDDVDAVARAEDERAHLRVPALRLVAEVHARLEQGADRQGELAGSQRLRHGGGGLVFGGGNLRSIGHGRAPSGCSSAPPLRPTP